MTSGPAGTLVDTPSLGRVPGAVGGAIGERFTSAFECAPAGMAMTGLATDRIGVFEEVNDAFCEVTGYSRSQLRKMSYLDITHPDDRPGEHAVARRILSGEITRHHGESRYLHRHGHTIWVRAGIAAVSAATPLYTILHVEDITGRKETEAQLRRLAFHDALTGLPNRLLLLDRIQQGLTELARSTGSLALLFVDLDDFKTVNDSRGHLAGDEVLVEVARRLAGVVRASDTVARMGGDEFVVVCRLRSHESVEAVAARIRAALRPPVTAGAGELAVTASVGAVAVRTPAHDPHDLLAMADAAMYRRKHLERRAVAVRS